MHKHVLKKSNLIVRLPSFFTFLNFPRFTFLLTFTFLDYFVFTFFHLFVEINLFLRLHMGAHYNSKGCLETKQPRYSIPAITVDLATSLAAFA